MRIVNLIENTEGTHGCAAAHGLSFYIETKKHKLLMDLGPSEESLRNAEILGIDLGKVDTMVLSHGHYDHSGGIPAFSKINQKAVIYMQQTADGEHYADEGPEAEGERFRYIGIDRSIVKLPQVRKLQGDFRIDDELSLYTIKRRTHEPPFTNRSILLKKGDDLVRDEFEHEQYLVVSDEGRNVLLSGCAHNGILNIMEEYLRLYGSEPDIVVSGFHLMKQTEYTECQLQEIKDIAAALKGYRSRFVTCHCTGLPAYEVMKSIMGDRLEYIHSGEELK